ncbi:Bifunctional enzyme MurC/Ddl [Bienertia sinuspersici]
MLMEARLGMDSSWEDMNRGKIIMTNSSGKFLLSEERMLRSKMGSQKNNPEILASAPAGPAANSCRKKKKRGSGFPRGLEGPH